MKTLVLLFISALATLAADANICQRMDTGWRPDKKAEEMRTVCDEIASLRRGQTMSAEHAQIAIWRNLAKAGYSSPEPFGAKEDQIRVWMIKWHEDRAKKAWRALRDNALSVQTATLEGKPISAMAALAVGLALSSYLDSVRYSNITLQDQISMMRNLLLDLGLEVESPPVPDKQIH